MFLTLLLLLLLPRPHKGHQRSPVTVSKLQKLEDVHSSVQSDAPKRHVKRKFGVLEITQPSKTGVFAGDMVCPSWFFARLKPFWDLKTLWDYRWWPKDQIILRTQSNGFESSQYLNLKITLQQCMLADGEMAATYHNIRDWSFPTKNLKLREERWVRFLDGKSTLGLLRLSKAEELKMKSTCRGNIYLRGK